MGFGFFPAVGEGEGGTQFEGVSLVFQERAERGNGVVSASPSGGYNHDVLSKYPSAAHWLNLGASEQEQGGLRKL